MMNNNSKINISSDDKMVPINQSLKQNHIEQIVKLQKIAYELSIESDPHFIWLLSQFLQNQTFKNKLEETLEKMMILENAWSEIWPLAFQRRNALNKAYFEDSKKTSEL